jgi:SAM-dependent methyltransferase
VSDYSEQFFQARAAGARSSAEAVVPVLLEYVRPRSVVDIGCGTGEWLAAFGRHPGVEVLGVDGDYVRPEMLHIPADRFRVHDLCTPLRLDRTFDLAVSLEVAEHLPEACAAGFVSGLAALAPVVLFSAAIPLQGGTGHVNERWPEYWAGLFQEQGFAVVDCLRDRIWDAAEVEVWYKQNMLLFVRQALLNKYPGLEEAHRATKANRLSRIHPDAWLYRADPRNVGLRTIFRVTPGLVLSYLKRAITRSR